MEMNTFLYIGLTVLVGVFGYLLKQVLAKIDRIDKSLQDHILEDAKIQTTIATKLDLIIEATKEDDNE